MKRILWYLNDTTDHGLQFSHQSDAVLHAYTNVAFNSLSAFSDVDWAGFPDNHQSTG